MKNASEKPKEYKQAVWWHCINFRAYVNMRRKMNLKIQFLE